MRIYVTVAAIVIVCGLFVPFSYAQEEQEITEIEGKLMRYDNRCVVVDDRKIGLCRDVEVFDDNDAEITLDGLVATETVAVTVKGGCAVRIKALVLRK